MQTNRINYVKKNAYISFLTQFIQMFLRFVLQTIIVRNLGIKYLGINGLFTNILSVLSLAELGIGTAIVFSLYEPLAHNNKEKISAYMNFYKKVYYAIGSMIGVLGLLLLPFLNFFIKNNTIKNIHFLFLLFLINAVVSYFFTYKRTLLTADQKDYINQINIFIFSAIQITMQGIVILILKSYILFLIVQIICTISSNLIISKKVDKEYAFLSNNRKNKINESELQKIKKNVFELIGVKIGGVAIQGTDNLLISTFVGISSVGIYSNYSLITSSVILLQNKIIGSTVASIGNLATENNSQKSEEIFKKHFLVNFILTVFCASLLLNIFPIFITIWLDKSYNFPITILIIIVLNYYFQQLRQTAISFLTAYGALQHQGLKSLIESVINLIISFVLVLNTNLGVGGALLGTLITNIIINSWFENRQVFKLGLKRSVKPILIMQYKYIVLGLMMVSINFMCINFISIEYNLLGLLASLFITVFIFLIMLLVIFIKDSEFRKVLLYIKNIF